MNTSERNELEGLIQDVLDGAASPEDVKRLERWLERDPAARKRHAQMGRLFAALERVSEAEAPPALKQGVLRSLRLGDYGEEPRVGSFQRAPFWKQWFGVEFWRIQLRHGALPFASGVGVGAVVLALALGGVRSDGFPDPAGVSGTLVPTSEPAPDRVDERALGVPGAQVSIETLRWGRLVYVRIDARSQQGAKLKIRCDAASFRFWGLHRSIEAKGGLTITPSDARLQFDGAARYTLVLEQSGTGAAPIQVTLASGEAVAVETLRTAL